MSGGKFAWKSLWMASVLLAGLGLLMACQAQKQPDNTLARQWQPKRLAVLPFQMGVTDPGGGAVRSPLTGAAFLPGPIVENATVFLDENLSGALPEVTDLEIVPSSEAGRVFDRLRREDLSLTVLAAAMQAGQKVKADGVVIGYVYRFSQRVGESYSAAKPASVAFDLALIRVSDGAILWKNSFDETQRSVSEDIIEASQYMDRGVRWFTVYEWADYGLDQLLKRFPYLKEHKEQKGS